MKLAAGMLLAALALFAFQLVRAQTSSAGTGVACPQTGNELVATDQSNYSPGDLVHINGMGYSSSCDVVVKVRRPDGSVVTGDGSNAPGSDAVTTDILGGLSYDYQLQATPALQGTYSIDVLGGADVVLAHTTFVDAPKINFSAAPNSVLASSSRVVALEVTNTGGDAFPATNTDNIRCVKATFPAGWTPISVVGAATTRAGQTWTASVSGQTVTATANNAGTDQVYKQESVLLQVATTTPAAGNSTITAQGWNDALCAVSMDSKSANVAVEASDTDSYTAASTPASTRSNASRTYTVSLTNTSSSANPASRAKVYIPIGFTVDTGRPITATPSGNAVCGKTNGAWIADGTLIADGRLNFKSGGNTTDLCSGATLNVTFTAVSPSSGSGPFTWVTELATGQGFLLTGSQPTVAIDNTPPSVTINQAGTQNDPTTGSPINFTATFSEPVTGFTGSDVSFIGSTAAGTLSAAVTGGPTVYNVAVSGMTSRGTVVASIPAGSAADDPGNSNTASTSTDNTVTWDRVPATTAPTFSPNSPKTNDLLTASTTTSDPDGDNVSVAWTWKVNRGGDICTIQTNSSASAPAGVRTASLALSANYVPTSCTGATINPLNPSKGDSVVVEATPNDGLFDGSLQSSNVTIANTTPTVTLSVGNDQTVNEGSTHTYSYTISDPDGDAIASVATSCGANGNLSNASNTNLAGSFDCTFPDGPASSIVSAQATDTGFGAGAGNTATQTVTVNNVAPTVTFSAANDQTVNEGATIHTYSYTISDPGQDTVTSGTTSCDPPHGQKLQLSDTNTNTSGSFQCIFPDGPDSANLSASATDSDSDTGAAAQQTVTVHNVAPTVTYTGTPPSSANEGELRTFNFSVSDPGNDSYTVTSDPGCGSSGSYVFGSLAPFGGSGTTTGSFICSFPDDNPTGTASDSTNVTISFTDSDLDSGNTATQGVTVHNVNPSVDVTGPADVNESSTHTYGYTFDTTDPGTDTFTHGTPDCGSTGDYVMGSLSFDPGTGDGRFECLFTDDNPTGTPTDPTIVSIEITDDDTGSDTGSQTVTVHNVDPSVKLTGATDVNEGDNATYTFDTTDPGTADTFSHGAPECGTGNYVAMSLIFSSATGDGSFDCHFTDDDPTGTPQDLTTVSIQITDDDTGLGTGSQNVTVHNVNPAVDLTGPTSVNESTSALTYNFHTTDPGTADTFTHGTPDCGSSGSFVSGSVIFDAASGDGSFDCKFLDDNPTGTPQDNTTVSITVTDDDTGSGTDAKTVTVHNVAPTVHLSGTDTANEGDTAHYTYTWTDPGTLDTFPSHSVDCGVHGHLSGANFDASSKSGNFDCTWSDDSGGGTADVTVSVSDDDGGTGSDTIHVAVGNLPPTALVTGPSMVDEGSIHTYNFTVSDPGSDDTFTVNTGENFPNCGGGGHYVNNSLTTTAHGGSFECFFPDGPASTEVKVKVTDDDGASDTGDESVQIVQVANVNPTVTSPGDQGASEGTSHSFSLGSFSDPGTDSPWNVSVNWGDSSTDSFQVTAGGAVSNQSLGSLNHTYADNGGYTVTVTVTDKNSGAGSASFTANVANVAPTATFTNDGPVSEGTSFHLSLTGAHDDSPVDQASLIYAFDCGDGSGYGAFTSTASATCPTNDDGVRGVKAEIKDKDGDVREYIDSVTVDNVPPTIAISGAANTDEGSSYSLTLGPVTDPGQDTVSSYIVHWGDGNSDTYSNNGAKAHIYADGPNNYNVTADLVDEDGTFLNRANAFSVHVNNVAPNVIAAGNQAANAGTSATFLIGSFTDPGDDGPWAVTVNWGDASANDTFNEPNPGNIGARSHTYAAGGTYTVTVTVAEAGTPPTPSDSDAFTVTVAVASTNHAPDVTITAPSYGSLYAKGASVTVTGTYTDPDAGDTHTCTISWDDNTSSQTVPDTEPSGSTAGSCSGTRQLTAAGVYTIQMTVTDNGNLSDTDQVLVVVYDPAAGYITGGGWLNVDQGYCTVCGGVLSGRANFGFNSQYKKGQTVPTGETEFQFQAGNLNFHSTMYSWLVVSGYKAQYKGSGTVNGVSGYNFTLTAYDGDIGGNGQTGYDRFRIVISKNGLTVFDNRNGASMDMDSANPQNIGGGSIVIHKA